MTLKFIPLIASLFLLSFVTMEHEPSEKKFNNLRLGPALLSVEVAETETDHYLGLSRRPALCDNCGLLFVFGDSRHRTFVMREMNFDLDIIWLDNKTIIAWAENLKPEAGPNYTLYSQPEKTTM